MDASTWRIAISSGAALILTPFLLRALTRAFPARRLPNTAQSFDAKRFSRIDLFALISSIVCVWTAICVGIALHFPNSWWFVAYTFGWLITPMLVVIASGTLLRGVDAWREYWAFQEQQSGMSFRFFVPICFALSLLGIIATFILYAHRNA